ncbi:hypothetical protein C5B78_22365 [Aeromonas salmonicida]|jgi:hypothetical protein|uniref:hypothetical protein n=1 Tax=Aeromonas salmonicida TaxID=645 RepID=UPI000F791AAC|nr:hypothetical protein [Aeromonas salmonicida]RSM21641.1 hypothetical protein C5B78_22365 [Aeromonas salmonicida]
MRIEEPIKFFGSAAKAARAIGYNRVCFNDWRKNNHGVVSERAAIKFVLASCGQLDLGKEDYAEGESQNEDQQAA